MSGPLRRLSPSGAAPWAAASRLWLCLVLFAPVLDGCVSSEGGLVAGETLRGEPLETVRAVTVENGTVTVGPFATVGSSCTVMQQAKASVLSRPRFGAARTALAWGDVALAPTGLLYPRCNEHKIVGTTVIYTPRPGFTGEDSFSFRLRFVNGEVRRITVNVTVNPS
jgi:hypothetical protein